MSCVHHEPDPSVVPCRGCGLLTSPDDLVRLTDHGGFNCCSWHPFHRRCVRDAGLPPASWEACAVCHERFDAEALRAAVLALVGTAMRAHGPSIDPASAVVFRRVTAPSPRAAEVSDADAFDDVPPVIVAHWRRLFEALHRACLEGGRR